MRRVHITIDTEFPDRPCADPIASCDEMLDVLARKAVTATFFIVGSWARAHPDRVQAIHRAGHQIGNHTYSHCNLARMSPEGIMTDLSECEATLTKLGVESRPWFRAPYGELASSRSVATAIKRAGYRHVPWHADGEDWRPGPASEVAARALAQIERRWPWRATVLLHSWPDQSPEALELLLTELTERGAKFATFARSRWLQR